MIQREWPGANGTAGLGYWTHDPEGSLPLAQLERPIPWASPRRATSIHTYWLLEYQVGTLNNVPPHNSPPHCSCMTCSGEYKEISMVSNDFKENKKKEFEEQNEPATKLTRRQTNQAESIMHDFTCSSKIHWKYRLPGGIGWKHNLSLVFQVSFCLYYVW